MKTWMTDPSFMPIWNENQHFTPKSQEKILLAHLVRRIVLRHLLVAEEEVQGANAALGLTSIFAHREEHVAKASRRNTGDLTVRVLEEQVDLVLAGTGNRGSKEAVVTIQWLASGLGVACVLTAGAAEARIVGVSADENIKGAADVELFFRVSAFSFQVV
jgi:hypothetical protein